MDELLLAEEIEERLSCVRMTIKNINYRKKVLMKNPGISDKDYRAKTSEMNKDIRRLQKEIQAYETAINYACL